MNRQKRLRRAALGKKIAARWRLWRATAYAAQSPATAEAFRREILVADAMLRPGLSTYPGVTRDRLSLAEPSGITG